MDVDYSFCEKTKLCAMDLIVWLDLSDAFEDGCCWDLFGRNAMIIDDRIRISCAKSEFDRWANSEDMEFDIKNAPDRRRFVRWVKNEREQLESFTI